MTTILVILGITVAVGILAVFWEMRKLRTGDPKAQTENEKMREYLVRMETSVNALKDSQQTNLQGIQQQLRHDTAEMNERLTKAAVELAKVQEHTASMKELQQILKSPKLRGGIGEDLMRSILEQNLPKQHFKMQYRFKSGEAVDAVIRTKAGLIPVDSKFPVDKYQAAYKVSESERAPLMKEFHQQVKKHIDSIAKKYILPAEKTVSYALMYVPGEPIFREISDSTDLVDYAAKKSVMFVGPQNFLYFLMLVQKTLEGEAIGERANEILAALQSIQQDSVKLGEDLGVLNKHLTSAGGTMQKVHKSYGQLDTKITNTGQLEAREETVSKKLQDLGGPASRVAELPDEPVSEEASKRA